MNRWRTEYAGTEFGPHEVDGLLGHAGGSDAEGLLESLDRMNDQLDRWKAARPEGNDVHEITEEEERKA